MPKLNDFFCGAGGLGLGFIRAGFEIAGAWDYDKWAVMTYHANVGDHVKQADITQMTWEDVPSADAWAFGFPCFKAGTLITTNKGLVRIEEIQENDMVLTHTNRFQRVVKPMAQVKKGIYALQIQGSPETFVTEEHPYYVRHKTKSGFSEPEWVEVKDLKVGDYVGFALNKEVSNLHSLTEEECFLLGRYVADGYLMDGPRIDRPSPMNKITFCIGKKKLDEFVSKVSEYKLGISEETTAYKVRIFSDRLVELCKACGKGAENKEVPGFVMDLPILLLQSFLDGYMSGDGCLTQGKFKATSVSQKLIYQLGQIVNKAYGAPYCIYKTERPKTAVIEGRTVNQLDTWQLTFRKEVSKKPLARMIDGVMWCPVRAIEYDPDFHGVVYNMEVEEDNSYVANNCTVHNCQDLSVAGAQEGMKVKCECEHVYNRTPLMPTCPKCGSGNFRAQNRSGLFYEVMRLIDETGKHAPDQLPSFLVAENVKGLAPYIPALKEEYEKRGYKVYHNLYNSKYWDVPQSRERFFVVGVRGDHKFEFAPESTENIPNLWTVLDQEIPEKYYMPDSKASQIIEAAKALIPNVGSLEGEELLKAIQKVFTDRDGVSYCCDANYAKGISPEFVGTGRRTHIIEPTIRIVGRLEMAAPDIVRRVYDPFGIAPTLTTCVGGHSQPKIIDYNTLRVRKLTPNECGRLQAFPIDNGWVQVVSDAQAYKQFGNAVSVTVAEAVAKAIKKSLEK